MKTSFAIRKTDIFAGFLTGIPALLSAFIIVLMLLHVFIAGLVPFITPEIISGVSVVQIIAESVWDPFYRGLYGFRPLLAASFLAVTGALFLAVMVSVPGALFAATFLPPFAQRLYKAIIARCADMPAILFGFFGLFWVVPFLENIFGFADGRSLLAVISVLFLMILPGLTHAVYNAFRAIPTRYFAAAKALGATDLQAASLVSFPYCLSKITAAILRYTARALGESAAIVMIAGNSPVIPESLSSSIRTLAGNLLLEAGVAHGTHSRILLSSGVVLFLWVGIIHLIGRRIEASRGEGRV